MKCWLTMLLLMMAMLPAAACAQTNGQSGHVITVLLRGELPQLQSQAAAGRNADALHKLESIRGFSAVFPPSKARSEADLHAMERHRLTRYYQIDFSGHSMADVNALLKELEHNPLVEEAYIEPTPVSLDQGEPPRPEEPDMAAQARAPGDPPDHTGRQNYLMSPTPVDPYKLGGLNANEVRGYPGGKGEDARVISDEGDHWSYNHVDLPKPFIEHCHKELHKVGSHDTSSAGIMFSLDNGYGTIGFVPKAAAGYTKYHSECFVDLGEHLHAGDVVQVGVHYGVGPLPDPPCPGGGNCYLPVEFSDLTFDGISWLTAEKSVHVVIAAANGNLNLDDPYFEGDYDRNKRDSGAIYAGAADPMTGARAGFSEYGSRVDLFSWGRDVTTTSYSVANPTTLYTHTFNGTSSANPIIAGAVALMQSIANAEHIGPIAPKAMRQLLVDTGHPLPFPDPQRPIGVQPDLKLAVEKMLHDYGGGTHPPIATLAAPDEVESGQPFTLKAVLSNPNEQPVSYVWHTPDFVGHPGNEAEVRLEAPNVSANTRYKVAVQLSRGGHNLDLEETILVKKPFEETRPPVAVATAVPSEVTGVKQVVLSGQGSHNPDGGPLRYQWDQTGGPPARFVSGTSSEQVAAEIPVVMQNTTFTFRLIVSNSDDRTDSTTVDVTARPGAGAEPITINRWDIPEKVKSGQEFTVSVDAESALGKPLHYDWKWAGKDKPPEPGADKFIGRGANGGSSMKVEAGSFAHEVRGAYIRVVVTDDLQNKRELDPQYVVIEPKGDGGGDNCVPTDPEAGSKPAWSAGTTYNSGNVVQHNGVVWRASWYTQGAPPDKSDAFELVSKLPVPWQASRPYVGGTEVIYEGKVYKAPYWVGAGTRPGAGTWTLLREHVCP